MPKDDPREIEKYDPYNDLSSDDEDTLEIAKQLDLIDREKKDLLKRLEQKKRAPKGPDPNFSEIQVECSPKKLSLVSKVNEIVPKRVLEQEPEIPNPNESKAQNQLEIRSNSSPYFVKKYEHVKKEEQRLIQHRQELLSTRVHSFAAHGGSNKFKREVVDEQEIYSGLWIKERFIPKGNLDDAFQDVKILRLAKLFAKVKPPKFTEPQYSNWATIGILSNKGEFKFTSGDNPKKYFKFTLTDFQFNIDVYVFGKKNVERYYNLRTGDIIAILNPEILPWRPSGKNSFIKSFNLRISHEFPCILEIGTSRDLGWCGIFVKVKNKPCQTPINKAKEQCCDYHKESKFRSTNAKRVELSGSFALGAPTRIDKQPSLYRKKGSNSRDTFKLLPSWSGNDTKTEHQIKAHQFSNSKAAKAFFNEKYQNPDFLNNLDGKRRKIQDNKKDLVIKKKLQTLLNKQSTTYLVNKDSENYEAIRKTTESTLQSGLIQNLGFDPTHGKMAAILKNNSKKTLDLMGNSKQTAVSSLLNVKKDNVSLKPCKDILIQKKRHREQVWLKHFGDHSPPSLSDSDSDLEIVK